MSWNQKSGHSVSMEHEFVELGRGECTTHIDAKFGDGAIVNIVRQVLTEIPEIERHGQGLNQNFREQLRRI